MTAPVEYARIPRQVPEWHKAGLCAAFPELADAWHDSKPGSAEDTVARLICAACPVRLACATGALEQGEPWGIWGGLDRRDRKAIAVKFGYPAPAMLPEHGTDARYKKHHCHCPECKRGHAEYELERRARARDKARKRGLWVSPLVIVKPCRVGRRVVGVGQLLLPGTGGHRWAEPLAA